MSSKENAQSQHNALNPPTDARVETASETILRPSPLSIEQKYCLAKDLGILRRKLLIAIQQNGCGQALAWLTAQNKRKDASELERRLAEKLDISLESSTLLSCYLRLCSQDAVEFRNRVQDSLCSLDFNLDTVN